MLVVCNGEREMWVAVSDVHFVVMFCSTWAPHAVKQSGLFELHLPSLSSVIVVVVLVVETYPLLPFPNEGWPRGLDTGTAPLFCVWLNVQRIGRKALPLLSRCFGEVCERTADVGCSLPTLWKRNSNWNSALPCTFPGESEQGNIFRAFLATFFRYAQIEACRKENSVAKSVQMFVFAFTLLWHDWSRISWTIVHCDFIVINKSVIFFLLCCFQCHVFVSLFYVVFRSWTQSFWRESWKSFSSSLFAKECEHLLNYLFQ